MAVEALAALQLAAAAGRSRGRVYSQAEKEAVGAMLGAMTAAKAILGSAAAHGVEPKPQDAHAIAKEGEAHAVKALLAAGPFTP